MNRAQLTAQKFAGLQPFLPKGSLEKVLVYFEKYSVFLKITRERKSLLGDYRNPTKVQPLHRISVNANLNPYSFLITLLHEIAHMLTFVNYGPKVSPHGPEWQAQYRRIITKFLNQDIFPKRLEKVILESLMEAKASTCSDPALYRALKAYDKRPEHLKYVEDIPTNALFHTLDGKKFQMLGKLRTRYRCKDIKTGKLYNFHPMVEVTEAVALSTGEEQYG